MNRKTYLVEAGQFRTDSLIPGSVVFEFRGDGDGQVRRKKYEFVVPDQETDLDFLDLLDTQYEYPSEVVGQAQQAAREARAAATDAEAAAAVVGSAEAVLSARDEAEDAADASIAARDAAAASATAAAVSESEAKSAETNARAHNNSASASESAAAASKNAAAASATAAATSESAAAGSAEAADGSRVAAESARDAAALSDTAAASSATAAGDSATAASESAAAAASSAALAQSAASVAADDVRDELSGLVSTASGHASDAADSAAAAAQSAQDAASVVSDGVPDASTSMKGKVKLAGDLGGTADSPTVPGLASKSDVGHQHAISDVTDLQSTLDGKVSTVGTTSRVYGTSSTGLQTTYLLGGTNAASGTIAFRTTGGAIVTGEPTAANHAATKASVERRPALFSGAGAPPTSIPGAVVGDWWLNENTMELSKITGV